MRELVKPVQLLLCVCLVGFATLGFAQARPINERTVYGSGGFPFRITQPGSYILYGNLTVPVNTDGIDISADNVSLDMNGFTISAACPPSVNRCSSGIGISSGNDNTKVTNGSVVGFQLGLAVDGSGALAERVSAKSNLIGIAIGQGAVGAQGTGSGTVRNCSASRNVVGMELANSVVEGNTFSYNGVFGLGAWNSTVIANSFLGNPPQNDIAGNFSVFGSNSFNDNTSIIGDLGFTSQNNNNCSGTKC